MDNAIYVGLSRQVVLQRALDLAANNVANMDTAGFKVEQLNVHTNPMALHAAGRTDLSPVNYVLDSGVARNFGQGELQQTGNTYDLAIQGDGFFTVQTAGGNRYTRDGQFTVDTQNRLVTKQGDPVLDASGATISVDPTKAAPVIGKDGTISQSGVGGQTVRIGKLGAVRFADLSALSKDGGNLYVDNGGQTPEAATDSTINQGVVEKSNVSPVLEVTNLISITRAYERMQDMMTSTQDMSTKAIDSLGKLN